MTEEASYLRHWFVQNVILYFFLCATKTTYTVCVFESMFYHYKYNIKWVNIPFHSYVDMFCSRRVEFPYVLPW